MTLAQFIATLIKCLSDFQGDWKESKYQLKDKMPFADWLAIFEKYALKAENEENEPF